eukprot:gene16054-biopygen11271
MRVGAEGRGAGAKPARGMRISCVGEAQIAVTEVAKLVGQHTCGALIAISDLRTQRKWCPSLSDVLVPPAPICTFAQRAPTPPAAVVMGETTAPCSGGGQCISSRCTTGGL